MEGRAARVEAEIRELWCESQGVRGQGGERNAGEVHAGSLVRRVIQRTRASRIGRNASQSRVRKNIKYLVITRVRMDVTQPTGLLRLRPTIRSDGSLY
jgi:hypothetical protein